MELLQIFKDIGIFGIGATVIGLLVKYFIDKRFKSYEIELQAKSIEFKLALEKKIESHKADLNLLSFKKEKLHFTRLEVVSELFKRIVKLNFSMQEMFEIYKKKTENFDKEEEKRIKKAGNSYNYFSTYYREHEIYFSDESCKLLDSLIREYSDSIFDYTYEKIYGIKNPKGFTEVYKKVSEEIPNILGLLKKEFRKIIDVE